MYITVIRPPDKLKNEAPDVGLSLGELRDDKYKQYQLRVRFSRTSLSILEISNF